MEPTHETHTPGSTKLENSHYVTERLVYAPSVQPTLVQLLQVHLPPPIQVIGTPRTSGRMLDEDFASFTLGNIRASAAQITTRRIIAEPNPAAASPLSSSAVSQEQLLEICIQYEAAKLLAKTAEAEARAALARKTAQQLDLETRPGSPPSRLSSSNSPSHYSPTASPPRMFSPPATRHPTPTPSQQATTDLAHHLGAVLLHLKAQHRADALQREEERRIEQRQHKEDHQTDRQAAEERAAPGLAGALGGADQRPAPRAPERNRRPAPRAPRALAPPRHSASRRRATGSQPSVTRIIHYPTCTSSARHFE